MTYDGPRPMSARPGGAETASTLQVHSVEPPAEFACVCPYVFRCADPSSAPESYAFLESLGLRSIVLLSIEDASSHLEKFCARNRVILHHFGIERRWPMANFSGSTGRRMPDLLFLSPHGLNSYGVVESIVKDALELLLDVRNHPVLVTDTCVAFCAFVTQFGYL